MPSSNRRVWRQQEDQAMLELIDNIGNIKWAIIAQNLQNLYGYKKRTGKQCRERWCNQLSPNLQRGDWSFQQKNKIFQYHQIHGTCWIKIAHHLPGRTDNAIKNLFYSIIRKALRKICRKLGVKNSTTEIGAIKPITISKIFAIDLYLKDQPTTQPQIQQRRIIKQKCKFVKQQIMKYSIVLQSDQQIHRKMFEATAFDAQKYKKLLRLLVELNGKFAQQQRLQRQRASERYRQRLDKRNKRDKVRQDVNKYIIKKQYIQNDNLEDYGIGYKIQENDNDYIYNNQDNSDQEMVKQQQEQYSNYNQMAIKRQEYPLKMVKQQIQSHVNYQISKYGHDMYNYGNFVKKQNSGYSYYPFYYPYQYGMQGQYGFNYGMKVEYDEEKEKECFKDKEIIKTKDYSSEEQERYQDKADKIYMQKVEEQQRQ